MHRIETGVFAPMNPPSMGTGDYFTVHHYIDGCRPFIAKAIGDIHRDDDDVAWVVPFVAVDVTREPEKGFWQSEAIWVECSHQWAVRDEGYSNALDVDCDDWNPPQTFADFLQQAVVEKTASIKQIFAEGHGDQPTAFSYEAAVQALTTFGADDYEDIAWILYYLIRRLAADDEEMRHAYALLHVLVRETVEPAPKDD